ncbi:MAG: MBL fold metallo-hydrolase [Desulfarculaceae bacterium]|nr:MBL fold metallo-hydrolase [Desulfarculaceae bacterium]MCF8072645.1 MBL fold metallo-hydrolase [Desulfarculaceae bacterium]MCF8102524.1 MBL fold metallo-hydrolase [Desulfarculaceae bacterium]MCF8117973.1 MBL fold metallo-hydrolase [Desulfarculaceae bacterium]
MTATSPGPIRVAENLYLLGHRSTPVFLWDGPEPVLFEAGFTCLAPNYIADAKQVLDGRAPAWLLISHVHFDHCGAAGCFQETWPGLKIAVAPKAANIIERPNAIKLISQLNHTTARLLGRLGRVELSQEPFQPFSLERVLDNGDVLELAGGRRVEVLATPGHTWDSLSFYLPREKILMASEATGIEAPGGYIVSELLVSYADYVASMRRLAELEVELLCLGHHTTYTGPAARAFIANSLAAAELFKDWVLRLVEQEGGDLERVVELVKAGEYDHRPEPKQPLDAYMLNLQARVAQLAREFASG